MNSTMRKALHIMLTSLALAFIFNYLFFQKTLGISFAIFVFTLFVAVVLLGMQQRALLKKSWWLFALILFFALMPGIRANEFLTFLNVCATFALLILLAHGLAGTPAFVMKLRDYLVLMIFVPFRMLGRVLFTVSQMNQIHSNSKHRDMWLRVVKGVIMAVPILIIFGALFSQADLAFSQFINRFVDITISERSVQYLVLLFMAFIAALCFLSYIFFPKQYQSGLSREQSHTAAAVQSGKGIEVLVFLGLISVLFLVFIGFQITYLFGGEANIVNAGFTYAEYARRGFWELLVVALLSLVVLLVSEKYAGAESIGSEQKRHTQFLIPALVLIIEVVVIIVSAFKRLSLYIDAYGMTTLRFYVAGFILLLFVLFVVLAVKFIQSKPEQFFAFGTLLSLAAFLILVNIVNPDVFIARYNMKAYHRTGKIDVMYVGALSSDAESEKIELYKTIADEDTEFLRELFQNQKARLEKQSAHWQSANFARARALKLLQEL
ncbi:MAG: DUF4173 domain-containing protein [Candidatus Kerfeldbacteria bacterium]|nr:DUF4173 domain-containing protein [Candidatus Kerfeldbacteria bacterium]